ncbi:APC family permease [Mycoplasma capricolum]|uniref:Amino acid permease n=1 Tax=Mycoplasma capricolum subsp. capripneumoniae 87001 TaxID=1124992 RepID=A0A9N7B723_MYCCC|nr:APC family permease [Mycoplasma capricolum]AJK51838.1 amino acid permease [Mycoplasma capricolum subsp. capripneumoniae 87001]
MKNKSRFFEFLTLFMMSVGTIVGSGIYVKNRDILIETHNPIIAIVLWTAVGISCIAVVYLFLEISSSTENGTIGSWSRAFFGHKVGSFFANFQTMFYAPVNQAIFTSALLAYFLNVFDLKLYGYQYLLIFLLVGAVIILLTNILNVFSIKGSKAIQIFGTGFKFFPLIIALIAGFILADHFGALQNNGVDVRGITDSSKQWSRTDFDPLLFFRGFGGILFAFDGFIYICNSKKRAKHADFVPIALVSAMAFAAVFYLIMSLSLILGSPDGSIEQLLERVFNNGQPLKNQVNHTVKVMAAIISMIICFLGLNAYSYIGMAGLESDVIDKLSYVKSVDDKHRFKKIGLIQGVISYAIFAIFIIVGASSSISLNKQINVIEATDSASGMLYLIQIMSSTCSCLSFAMMASLIIAALINRKTNKVEVKKIKGFVPLAIFGLITFIFFSLMGLFTFIVPLDVIRSGHSWWKVQHSQGPLFLLLMVLGLIFVAILWYNQNKRLIGGLCLKNDSLQQKTRTR